MADPVPHHSRMTTLCEDDVGVTARGRDILEIFAEAQGQLTRDDYRGLATIEPEKTIRVSAEWRKANPKRVEAYNAKRKAARAAAKAGR